MKDDLETKIDGLSDAVTKLAAAVDKGFAAVASDIDDLATKFDSLNDKADRNHTELRSKLAGVEHRLDEEANTRQDQKIPARVVDLETKVFGKSRAPENVV